VGAGVVIVQFVQRDGGGRKQLVVLPDVYQLQLVVQFQRGRPVVEFIIIVEPNVYVE